ncbi:MAG: YjjG family noncanonical pyrimidine nucleotidase [Actinomycetota bacterium]
MRYPTVLFDLDHTLLDSDSSLQLALTDTLGEAGVADPDTHYGTFDELNRALWKQVEAGTMTPPEVHIERFRQLVTVMAIDADPAGLASHYGRSLGAFGELYPGARELLDRLTESGATMAMVTNGLSEVQRARISRLDLGAYFDAVVISAEVGTAKPGGDIFDIAFAELGRPDPAGAVMIGDNLPSDIKGGVDYGIATCWYNPHGHEAPDDPAPTHTVTDLAAIHDVVVG